MFRRVNRFQNTPTSILQLLTFDFGPILHRLIFSKCAMPWMCWIRSHLPRHFGKWTFPNSKSNTEQASRSKSAWGRRTTPGWPGCSFGWKTTNLARLCKCFLRSNSHTLLHISVEVNEVRIFFSREWCSFPYYNNYALLGKIGFKDSFWACQFQLSL
jgi:hypothetical protein